MGNHPIVLKLNRSLLEHFRGFLDKQEAKLADTLLLATLPPPGSLGTLHLHGSGHFRLTQALQVLTTRIRELTEEQTNTNDWRSVTAVVNQALWDYVEILEESVKELFIQVEQYEMALWNTEFIDVVSAFKELLAHRIEDLIWTYKRLEEIFLTYRATCNKRKNLWVLFGKFWSRFSSILDPKILNRLFRAEESLTMQYKCLSVNYGAYQSFSAHVAAHEKKLLGFSVFKELGTDQSELLIKLHRLIKIWEENSRHEVLKGVDLVKSVKGLAKTGTFLHVFREYFNAIRQNFYTLCRLWHQNGSNAIQKELNECKAELASLGKMAGCYREMLLRSDPNPYVRTRWGMAEWVVGPEPRKTRDLLQIVSECESLNKKFDHLTNSMEKGWIPDRDIKRYALQRRIEEVLHEMGQPLSSRGLMQIKAEHLIDLIDSADELGGSLGDVHAYLRDVYLRALRLDATYHVLHDYPHFEDLLHVHQAFDGRIDDREHQERMKLFQQVIRHIQHWLKEHQVNHHTPEVEYDEAAVQETLQSWLAKIQREPASEVNRVLVTRMLLEYRSLFSAFFHQLRQSGAEGQMLRQQFHFIDTYLDTIEKRVRQQTEQVAS